MKDVLIINLTRMGDLVQTTPVIRGLKETYPDVRITLLVNSAFSEICKYIPFIDRLVVFDQRGFKEVFCDNHHDLIEKFKYIENFLRGVNDIEYDMVINFTHSRSSAILLSLIRSKEVRGFGIDSKGFSIIKHPWIRYFFNVIPARSYNPFHLCDMYIKAAGVMQDKKGLHLHVPPDAEEWVDSILKRNGIGKGDLLIGLQLGASQDIRRWHILSFAELADKLAKAFGVRILLIGAPSEVSLGREFEELTSASTINLIGKTDLRDLAALLKRCQLLISNDTGPLHIATAVGTRVLGIFLATAHFRETGPYGEGHFVIEADIPCSPCGFGIECRKMICKDVIKVENVFELIKVMLKGEALSGIDGREGESISSALWKDVQVYQSYFDKDGLLEYRPLIRKKLNKKMLFTHIYRKTWLNTLDGKDINGDDIDSMYQSILEKIFNWYNFDSFDIHLEEIDALRKLEELADGALSTIGIISREAGKSSPNIELIWQIRTMSLPLDSEIENIGHIYPPLMPLSVMFKYEIASLEGEDILALSGETCRIYNDLKKHVSILRRIIERFKVEISEN